MLLSSILHEILYRGKTGEMSQAWSHVSFIYRKTHSKRNDDWFEWWTRMLANLNVFKTSKKDCILSQSNFCRRSSLCDDIESDKKIKNFSSHYWGNQRGWGRVLAQPHVQGRFLPAILRCVERNLGRRLPENNDMFFDLGGNRRVRFPPRSKEFFLYLVWFPDSLY